MRAEVSKMNENFAKFMELIKKATKVKVTDSSAFGFMEQNTTVDNPSRYPLERIGGDPSLSWI